VPKTWAGGLVAAVVMLVAGCTSNGGHATPPVAATSTPPVLAQTTTTVPAAISPIQWSRDAGPALSLGGGPTATVRTVLPPDSTGTWLIAGSRLGSDGVPTATVWTSTDGKTWQASELPGAADGSQANAAAQYRNLRVVVGSIGLGTNRRAAVWVSDQPGEPFTAAIVPTSPTTSSMDSVAAGALGVFAIGVSGTQFGVWSSTDGVQWSEATAAEAVLAGSAGAQIHAIAAQGTDIYAAGSVADGGATDAAMWSTSDGIHWRQVLTAQPSFSASSSSVPGNKVIYSLAALGTNGLAAVGGVVRDGSWFPVSWISPNGASWSEPSDAFSAAPTDAVVRAVSAIATSATTTELVATGGSGAVQKVWRSSDGLYWTSVSLPASAAASSAWRATLIAATATATVVADGDPGQTHVLVDAAGSWAEPSSDPAVFGPVQAVATVERLVPQLVGASLVVGLSRPGQTLGTPTSVTSSVLTTTDGRTWSTGSAAGLGEPPPPDGSIAVARLKSGWVAVGRAMISSGGSSARVAVAWISPDGRHWTQAQALDTPKAATLGATSSTFIGIGPGAYATPEAVCVAPPPAAGGTQSVVAVGRTELASGGTGAVAWWSHDGRHWTQAAVQPAPIAGGPEEMNGCGVMNDGFVSYGTTNGPGGAAPALWKSATGGTWTLQAPGAFGAGAPVPLTGVARQGSVWLAVGGNRPGPTDLWISIDGGSTWQRPSASGPPWSGAGPAVFSTAGFVGGRPLVAGTVDGRLAVWLGTVNPVPTA
jgi:hypothetical protein